MTTEQRNGRKPFEPTRDFTIVPNSIFRLYTRLPDFKAEHALLYAYLCSQYNVDYGYAFPSSEDIAAALNCSERTVTKVKVVLAERELVEIARHPTHGNDVYIVKPAITDEDTFFERFPEAREHVEMRQKATSQRREASALRKRLFEERVRNGKSCGS